MANKIKLFEQQKVRTHWDEKEEKWYFSVIDVIQILTESNNPRRYWSDLKRKLQQEGFAQLYENIVQLKLESADGKKYTTDCADRENWQKLGRSEKWIQQRMTGQETRNKLTDYWKDSGVEKNDEFAFLTNIIHTEWAGLSVKQHKNLKGLKTQNLHDHMSEAEIDLYCTGRIINKTNCRNR